MAGAATRIYEFTTFLCSIAADTLVRIRHSLAEDYMDLVGAISIYLRVLHREAKLEGPDVERKIRLQK